PSPRYGRFSLRWRAATRTTGRRSIPTTCRRGRPAAQRQVAGSHRVFSRRRWSAWELARRWPTCLLTSMVPMGPVVLAGDETLAARPGPHVFGTGRHREGGRATPSSTASRWGHQGGVFSVRVKLPFASRPWARPG